jgi:alpha-beta hydrolase superfamily lysophospholipase
MKRFVYGSVKQILRSLGYGIVGGLVVAITGLVVHLESRPELEVWHRADLDEEFSADSGLESFADYLALEERLFAQLEREVYDELTPEHKRQLNRYNRGSFCDPGRWPRNWNRSFEFPIDEPRAAVLLIHGMSDSPYSMRSLGERLHREGAWVVGMRVPGHGTAPSGLVDVEWQAMTAAVRLAMQHLGEKAAGKPLFIVGYSNGGALAVHYGLEAVEDAQLPMPQHLILLSPQIGITKLAALAAWQERLGHLLGLEKLAWNLILPEYDPFKYGSFALNAGKQAHLITRAIQAGITKLAAAGSLDRFPATLAFQSVVDATVSAPALVSGLFARLPENGHELVLFDVDRFVKIEPIMTRDPKAWLDAMLAKANHTFAIEVLSNESPDTQRVALHRRSTRDSEVEVTKTTLAWPRHIYSLSHVALPFRPDDPVYGGPEAGASPGIQLGNLAMRGERGVLQVSGTDMLRLRWNPFYTYVEQRVVEAVLGSGSGGS